MLLYDANGVEHQVPTRKGQLGFVGVDVGVVVVLVVVGYDGVLVSGMRVWYQQGNCNTYGRSNNCSCSPVPICHGVSHTFPHSNSPVALRLQHIQHVTSQVMSSLLVNIVGND